MNPEDPVCLCFHVTRRKVINFIRVEKPRRPSQLSQCFGAGTGCGWCRPYLERLLEQELAKQQGGSIPRETDSFSDQTASQLESPAANLNEVTFEQYAKGRAKYVQDGGGTPPPGATPIDEFGASNSPKNGR